MIASSPSRLRNLVAPDGSWVKADVFSDPDIYERELEKIFSRCWLLLCPESEIPHPGDFFATYMGEDPVLVVRQTDGSVIAMLNQCRHRGAALCRSDQGNLKAFTCTYHGWSYDMSGKLIAVPGEDKNFDRPVDRERWSARRVPRITIDNGLVLGCFDEHAPSFRESLGDAEWYFDAMFGRSDTPLVAIPGVFKWQIKCNWKLPAEQFTTDGYHFPISHISAITALAGDAKPAPPRPPLSPAYLFTNDFGHGASIATDPASLNFGNMAPTLAAFELIHRETVVPKLGGVRATGTQITHANIFPTLSYLPLQHTLRTWHPRGVDRLEVFAWTMVEPDAPESVREDRRTITARTFGSMGIFEQDDSANWSDVQRIVRGRNARQTELNYMMGRDGKHPDLPGHTQLIFSEEGGRKMYRRWLELLTAGD
jgi:phenylpropionate dioxygenase-like ring-hydroxylating dioxygenase large terminal subunit